MNIALPALIVFAILLPGFIARREIKRVERASLDYSPFGQVVTEAVVYALALHVLWSCISWLIGWRVQPAVVLQLLSSDGPTQRAALQALGTYPWITVAYFATLILASLAVPHGIRFLITRFRLDRDGHRLSPLLRFSEAPWYYLLSGADFKESEVPDFIAVSAIVNVAGDAYLYTGVLDEYFMDQEGKLDRLILEEVMRRPLTKDKTEEDQDRSTRFYPVDGDYFVLRYSEAITLNVKYVKLEPSGPATSTQPH